jgi:hypothetical protein
MIANEVVHGIRSKKDHGFLLKVDFHKAFNSILWEHIDTTMGYMGFGSHWRKLIFYTRCLFFLYQRALQKPYPPSTAILFGRAPQIHMVFVRSLGTR